MQTGVIKHLRVFQKVVIPDVLKGVLCTFRNGKTYNCDLSASLNIGARFFLREYAKLKDCPELPKTPQRTYSTLYGLVNKQAA